MGRNERIYEEAAALWRQLYGEPPPAGGGAELLDLIVGGLPDPSYSRLATPHLRPANICFPKG
ncbi:hypothetical protein [Phenylobacterium sp.]|uniref:hypothetical protein n=1 Tax=Phenylobacterium sp. TaxID=1871053 RepID=UPI0025F04465|nr:hypothetical protein [Phenylobacterium sp.]MBX3483620.1 hypothetical protein [Phenylobacterium sp.]MCW5761046.1 hypothetical protein [Phenylobacterium sp.]